MSFQVNVPPSLVAKLVKTEQEKQVSEEEPTGKKREDWRKNKGIGGGKEGRNSTGYAGWRRKVSLLFKNFCFAI